MKLVAIPFSHYSEKARWALEHYGLRYEQVSYLPLFHLPGVAWSTRLRLGRRDAVSSPFSTPILLTDDGEVIHDSAVITQWLTQRHATASDTLYPEDYVEAIASIERELHDRLGPHVRRWAYYNLMSVPTPALTRFVNDNVSRTQGLAFAAGRPLLLAALRRALKISAESALRSSSRVDEVFAAYAARVEGRSHLLGDRFTAADLSLAALAAPALLLGADDGYGATMPPRSVLPDGARHQVEAWRAHPVGQFVIGLYRRHRRATPGDSRRPAA